jgi:uncharacterized Zn ribbon protein
MFSAFHFHANRGDKRFKQLYKSSEKRIDSKPDKEAEVESNLNRSRNSRYMLVEKFRQAQGYSPDHQSLDPNQVKEEDEPSSSFSSVQRRHSGSSFEDVKYGRNRRCRVPGEEEAQGFDYSSSYNGTFSEVLTFNLSRDCNESDLFNNNVYRERFSVSEEPSGSGLRRASSSNALDSTSGASLSFFGAAKHRARQPLDWEFGDDHLLLCVKCNRNGLQMDGLTLICSHCSFEHKPRSSYFNVKEIKRDLQDFLRKHEFACSHKIEYTADGKHLQIACDECGKELTI